MKVKARWLENDAGNYELWVGKCRLGLVYFGKPPTVQTHGIMPWAGAEIHDHTDKVLTLDEAKARLLMSLDIEEVQ